MPHYVNIALGIIFWPVSFCLQRWRSSLFFGFYLMIIVNYKSQQNNVLPVRGDKKPAWRQTGMTKNKPEGQGSGAATKNAGANRRFLGAAGINLCFYQGS
jgi:hypothetical protein